MFNTIFTALENASGDHIDVDKFIIALSTSFILGLVLSLTYLKTRKDKMLSQSFIITLTILPAIVTIIIMLVGTNIARAFSLAGAFSIIRFRSEAGDPEDITYVLFSMAVGLSCGMGYISYAVIVGVILIIIIILLKSIKFGDLSSHQKLLRIVIPEDLDFQKKFDEIFNRHASKYNLIKMKVSNIEGIYILDYIISLKDETHEKILLDEIRMHNNNLAITLLENNKVYDI